MASALLLAFTTAGYGAPGKWRLLPVKRSLPPAEHVALLERTLSEPSGKACLFTMVFFDESHYTMEVAANRPGGSAQTTAGFATDRGAIAVCNGGYFDPRSMLPTGLEIAEGIRTGSVTRALPLGGVLAIENGRASILSDDEYKDTPQITGLIQCSPRLVEKGQPITGMGGGDTAQRTFVATDEQGKWIIGICTSISLPDLAQCLCTPELIPGFTVVRALNLDGGPSSALWSRSDDGGVSHRRESWKVRNVILVMPRKGKSEAGTPAK